MRSLQVFILFLAIGAAAAVLYGRIFGPAVPAPVESAEPASAAPSATPQAEPAQAPPAAAAPIGGTRLATPRAARPEPTDVETAQAKAARLAARETFSREQLKAMLQKTMAGKLQDRELTSSEYDRLADAVLRIRASQRVLQGIGESDPGSEVRGVYSDTLKGAFAEIQQITGVAPSGWGDVLADQQPIDNTGDNVSRAEAAPPEDR